MTAAPALDPNEFRKALGAFATGVTIITTRAQDGSPLGLTCNSFNSVSLNPPLVLWSLAENALSLPAFRAAKHWAVHVLAADQDQLSARFAKRGADKFGGLDVEVGVGEIPLLRGCTARFQCETAFEYQGGDHVIFVGKVLAFDRSESAPLVFHGGKYAHAAKRDPAIEGQPGSGYLPGSFNEDFLGYLLGRGHFQFFRQIRSHLAKEGLSDEEFHVLSTLTLKRTITNVELETAMEGVLSQRASAILASLINRGLVREGPAVAEVDWHEYELSDKGRELALRLIAAAKSVEAQLVEHLGAGEAAALKSLLHRLLSTLDPASVTLWGGGRRRGKVKTSGTGWSE